MLTAIEQCPSDLAGPLPPPAAASPSLSSLGLPPPAAASPFAPPHGAPRLAPGTCTCRVGCVEDVYFAAVLTGLGAPLPSPSQAAEFAGERFLPDAFSWAPWARGGRPSHSAGSLGLRMPLGFHGLHRQNDLKTWGCQRLSLMQRQCPAIERVFGDVAQRACSLEAKMHK